MLIFFFNVWKPNFNFLLKKRKKEKISEEWEWYNTPVALKDGKMYYWTLWIALLSKQQTQLKPEYTASQHVLNSFILASFI